MLYPPYLDSLSKLFYLCAQTLNRRKKELHPITEARLMPKGGLGLRPDEVGMMYPRSLDQRPKRK